MSAAVVEMGAPSAQAPALCPLHARRAEDGACLLCWRALAEEAQAQAEQLSAALEAVTEGSQHHALAVALGMSPLEPWPVLLARVKEIRTDARKWLALAAMVRG